MSRFYASIQGNRGEVTRQGTAKSGINAHPRGWDLGVRVRGYADGDDNVFAVWLTSGSGYGGPADKLIGRFRVEDLDKDLKVTRGAEE